MTGLRDVYQVSARTGRERFAGTTLSEFWRWMASDLVSNTTRGVFGEFLVALALGVADRVREEWACYDVRAGDIRVEVKTSAYLQYWSQEQLSTPDFDIAPRRCWDPKTGKYSEEAERWSDVYVFCLHDHKTKDTLEPLTLSQWRFFVLSTETLNEKAQGQKKIRLDPLRRLGAKEVSFDGIAQAVREAARPSRGQRVS